MKKCLCGGNGVIHRSKHDYAIWIECDKCDADTFKNTMTYTNEGEAEAVDLWNKMMTRPKRKIIVGSRAKRRKLR